MSEKKKDYRRNLQSSFGNDRSGKARFLGIAEGMSIMKDMNKGDASERKEK